MIATPTSVTNSVPPVALPPPEDPYQMYQYAPQVHFPTEVETNSEVRGVETLEDPETDNMMTSSIVGNLHSQGIYKGTASLLLHRTQDHRLEPTPLPQQQTAQNLLSVQHQRYQPPNPNQMPDATAPGVPGSCFRGAYIQLWAPWMQEDGEEAMIRLTGVTGVIEDDP
ncbi:hypothetical protein CRENBAI_018007 [Crenichthys baileyi]|uniref:Uncharacterized protein n=1 Tax=Crenichthys baileyi TaxID=28760 RepID=A0AAV9SQU2_9TELE